MNKSGIKYFYPTKEQLTEEDDVWFGLIEHADGYAVDMNYFVEREDDRWDGKIEEEYCVLYPCYPDENGEPLIDCKEFKRYNLDFSDPDWQEKLINAAYDYLMEIMNK